MIAFADFVPEVKVKGGLFQLQVTEELTEPLGRANEWIARESIDVINVETVVLPNIHESSEEGSTDTHLYTSGNANYWHQFIRVWYRSAWSLARHFSMM